MWELHGFLVLRDVQAMPMWDIARQLNITCRPHNPGCCVQEAN